MLGLLLLLLGELDLQRRQLLFHGLDALLQLGRLGTLSVEPRPELGLLGGQPRDLVGQGTRMWQVLRLLVRLRVLLLPCLL